MNALGRQNPLTLRINPLIELSDWCLLLLHNRYDHTAHPRPSPPAGSDNISVSSSFLRALDRVSDSGPLMNRGGHLHHTSISAVLMGHLPRDTTINYSIIAVAFRATRGSYSHQYANHVEQCWQMSHVYGAGYLGFEGAK